MTITEKNPLLALDVYKMGHMEQYVPGCNKVYSYLIARSDRKFSNTVFFGLQYYLQQYLSTFLEPWMADEFLKYREKILGSNSKDVEKKIRALCDLGYFPLLIKAVPEGTVMPVRNVLMTMTNTDRDFHWVVGFVESLILKIWYPITVASCCYTYRKMADWFWKGTVSNESYDLIDFAVHDFGYRGDSSEESAQLSGAAHLLTFKGSDTVPALPFIEKHYMAEQGPYMLSVPASEHSVMCSFGKDREFEAFENMLNLYPTGIVSIVSDTFNVWSVLTDFAQKLKPRILARDGKVVFRPDSGNPVNIICGDPDAPEGSNEFKGALRLLDEVFGSTKNDSGFKELNPSVGLIYGDGMYLERYEETLRRMIKMGYAPSNLVIGVGGILRWHSRDTMGFTMKATHVEVNDEPRDIEKDPITDQKKKSHKGLLTLTKEFGEWKTNDQQSQEAERVQPYMTPVFEDGVILRDDTFDDIRERVQMSL